MGMISSMSVHMQLFYASRANSGKITTFRRYPSLMLTCACLLKLSGSKFELLKSEFNAANFILRLYWSIFSHFVAIHA